MEVLPRRMGGDLHYHHHQAMPLHRGLGQGGGLQDSAWGRYGERDREGEGGGGIGWYFIFF